MQQCEAAAKAELLRGRPKALATVHGNRYPRPIFLAVFAAIHKSGIFLAVGATKFFFLGRDAVAAATKWASAVVNRGFFCPYREYLYFINGS